MTQQLTQSDLLKIIADQKAMIDKLASQATAPRRLTCKVSAKGAVSVYGLGRFPVTLYAGQWERLFEAQSEIATFLKANASLLATKP